jgi:hypothetical protein
MSAKRMVKTPQSTSLGKWWERMRVRAYFQDEV